MREVPKNLGKLERGRRPSQRRALHLPPLTSSLSSTSLSRTLRDLRVAEANLALPIFARCACAGVGNGPHTAGPNLRRDGTAMQTSLSPTPHEAGQQTLCVSGSRDGAAGDPVVPINGDVPGGLDALLPGGFMEQFDAAMSSMAIAEGLIEELSQKHPERADLIWHSFSLLRPTHSLMHKTDMIYRSHCREILQRVIDGADTRPGTAAECCIVCCETSQIAPLTVAGVGTYMRTWQAAGLPGHRGWCLRRASRGNTRLSNRRARTHDAPEALPALAEAP